MHDLVRQATALQASYIGGSKDKSWADQADSYAEEKKLSRKSSAAANLVRSDLGLPPVPA